MGAIAAQPLWLKGAVFRVGPNVGDLTGLALKQHSPCNATTPRRKCEGLVRFNVFRREAVTCGDIITCVSRAENLGHVRLAKPGGCLDQRVQHGSKIERRAADDLEHVGGGRLLLERFAQLVEQPRVLDREVLVQTGRRPAACGCSLAGPLWSGAFAPARLLARRLGAPFHGPSGSSAGCNVPRSPHAALSATSAQGDARRGAMPAAHQSAALCCGELRGIKPENMTRSRSL